MAVTVSLPGRGNSWLAPLERSTSERTRTKLAELSSPDLTLPDWCAAVTVAPSEAAEPSGLRSARPPATVTRNL
jgi:hypothetical protein